MGVAIKGQQYRWPNRTIPYVLAPDLGCKTAAEVAIKHWNDKSCIHFVPRGGEADYVLLYRLPGYALSDVGHRGGEQKIGLGDTSSAGIIIHELGHAVGLWHEHCRADRDHWVQVNLLNVSPKKRGNFAQDNIAGTAVATEDVGDYDYGSIMHYAERDFAIDVRNPVLKLLQQLKAGDVVGQRDGLSPGDIAAVAKMYP